MGTCPEPIRLRTRANTSSSCLARPDSGFAVMVTSRTHLPCAVARHCAETGSASSGAPFARRSHRLVVPGGGIEPPLCCQNWILSPARLPIPPSRLGLASGSYCDIEHLRDVKHNRNKAARPIVAVPRRRRHYRGKAASLQFRPVIPQLRALSPLELESDDLPSVRFRFPFAERADRADARATTLRQSLAAGRCEPTPRSNVRRSARTALVPGICWCSTIRASCVRVCAAGNRVEAKSNCCWSESSRRIEAWMQLRASHPPPLGGTIELARRRDRDRARARRPILPPAFRRAGNIRFARELSRASCRGAAAPVHRAQRRRGGPGALSNRVCAPSRARWPRRPRDCISTNLCSQRCGTAGSLSPTVTLHVGAGTFQPVETDDLSQHRMHSERFSIPERR